MKNNGMEFKALIYGLINPETGEVFYIGCTQKSLKHRHKEHYVRLKAAINGKVNMNNRFDYLINLLPKECSIGLIEEVDEKDMYVREKFWIKYYTDAGFFLTNGTKGGKGGNISSYYNEERYKIYSDRLKLALTGKKKPIGFGENLSRNRQGIDNPSAGSSKYGFVVAMNNGEVFQMFKYGFEVDSYFEKKSCIGNICKQIGGKVGGKPYGFKWELFNNLSEQEKEIALKTYKDHFEN